MTAEQCLNAAPDHRPGVLETQRQATGPGSVIQQGTATRVRNSGRRPKGGNGLGWSESDRLADKDDMDAAGKFLVDFQNLPDLTVLAVGGLGAGIFQLQAVLVDPLMRGLPGGDELCAPATKMTLAAPQA